MDRVTEPAALPPIFVVGAPRSGTTMLAAMLGSHSSYAIGPETHFFSKLAPELLDMALSDPAWPAVAVELLAGLTLAEQPVTKLFGLERADLERYLVSREPSIRAMLEALTVPFAAAQGKSGWAEKTPNHLLNLAAIRAHWPEARIVRIMRDPRDAAISACRLPAFSPSIAANLYMWRTWQDAARDFLANDARSYTIRYESIVENPEAELRALCEFLEIPYEPEMLDFADAANAVSTPAETWKGPVSKGLTSDRVFPWKKTLSTDLKALANDVTHEFLCEFDYERQPPSEHTRTVFRMSRHFVQRHERFVLGLSERNIRWLPSANSRQADMVVEQPEYSRIRSPSFLARIVLNRVRIFLGRR
jgi:hypothetical protein